MFLFLLVFVYLMCGLRQLFFFQCDPEMPKGWTPRVEYMEKWQGTETKDAVLSKFPYYNVNDTNLHLRSWYGQVRE